jgi:hypothetical protein
LIIVPYFADATFGGAAIEPMITAWSAASCASSNTITAGAIVLEYDTPATIYMPFLVNRLLHLVEHTGNLRLRKL